MTSDLRTVGADGRNTTDSSARDSTMDPGAAELPLLSELPVSRINPAVTKAEVALGSAYVLRRRIGFGSMGEVWTGAVRESGEEVAVKILRREPGEDAGKQSPDVDSPTPQ